MLQSPDLEAPDYTDSRVVFGEMAAIAGKVSLYAGRAELATATSSSACTVIAATGVNAPWAAPCVVATGAASRTSAILGSTADLVVAVDSCIINRDPDMCPQDVSSGILGVYAPSSAKGAEEVAELAGDFVSSTLARWISSAFGFLIDTAAELDDGG